jgi:hypothetical protein
LSRPLKGNTRGPNSKQKALAALLSRKIHCVQPDRRRKILLQTITANNKTISLVPTQAKSAPHFALLPMASKGHDFISVKMLRNQGNFSQSIDSAVV